MSRYADQIICVVRELKNDINHRLETDEQYKTMGLPMEEVDAITREAFKHCAVRFSVTESTVRNKCTRQMNIDTATFYQLVKDFVVDKDQTLVEKMVTYCPSGDSEAYIRSIMKRI